MNFLKWLSITDRFTKIYLDGILAGFGLNCSQYMYIIKICGEPGMTQGSLMESVYVHPSNIVRTISALEKKGYITKDACDEDRRTCRLYPTEKAFLVVGELKNIVSNTQEMLMEDVTEEEREIFQRVLMKAGKRIAKELDVERREDEFDGND